MFKPYIKKLHIKNYILNFYYGTEQAREWYDPLKPYAQLEYEWVVENINLKHQKIIDGGAHHGQYTVLFAIAGEATSTVIAVDPVLNNHKIINENLTINNVKAEIKNGVISSNDGYEQFHMISNGKIVKDGGVKVPAYQLTSIMNDATIVKLDIEGAEFLALPNQIDTLPSVHTWIIEIHPSKNNDPHQLINEFKKRQFSALWVNREMNVIEPYPDVSPSWNSHTTVFFVKKNNVKKLRTI